MLKPGQKIIYWNGDQKIVEITPDFFKELSADMQKYLRHSQPITKSGSFLTIPLQNGQKIVTRVIKSSVKGNVINVQASGSCKYRIEYVGIDLNKLLENINSNANNPESNCGEFPQICLK